MKRSRINSDSVYNAVMRPTNTDTRMDTFQIFCCIYAEYQFIPRLVSRSHTHIQKNYELAGLSRIERPVLSSVNASFADWSNYFLNCFFYLIFI